MNTTRQNKVSRLLQKELGMMFQRESGNVFLGQMITVTTVRITPDLAIAKIYVSIFPAKNKNDILELIREKTSFIRGEVGRKIKSQLRIIPELQFFVDDSLDYVEKIEALLKS